MYLTVAIIALGSTATVGGPVLSVTQLMVPVTEWRTDTADVHLTRPAPLTGLHPPPPPCDGECAQLAGRPHLHEDKHT